LGQQPASAPPAPWSDDELRRHSGSPTKASRSPRQQCKSRTKSAWYRHNRQAAASNPDDGPSCQTAAARPSPKEGDLRRVVPQFEILLEVLHAPLEQFSFRLEQTERCKCRRQSALSLGGVCHSSGALTCPLSGTLRPPSRWWLSTRLRLNAPRLALAGCE
jgi:hypothetical protein